MIGILAFEIGRGFGVNFGGSSGALGLFIAGCAFGGTGSGGWFEGGFVGVGLTGFMGGPGTGEFLAGGVCCAGGA